MRQTPQTFSNPLLQGMRTPGLAASEQQRSMRLEDAYHADRTDRQRGRVTSADAASRWCS